MFSNESRGDMTCYKFFLLIRVTTENITQLLVDFSWGGGGKPTTNDKSLTDFYVWPLFEYQVMTGAGVTVRTRPLT